MTPKPNLALLREALKELHSGKKIAEAANHDGLATGRQISTSYSYAVGFTNGAMKTAIHLISDFIDEAERASAEVEADEEVA